MLLDVLSTLLVRSSLLLLATASLFWGVAGCVAARRSGRSRALGALVGAALPVVGAPLMLLPRTQPRTQPRPGPRSPAVPLSTPAPVAVAGRPAVAGWSPPAPQPSAWAAPQPSAWAAPPPPGWRPPAPEVDVTSRRRPPAGDPPSPSASVVLPLLLLAPAVLGALALLGAATEPWLVARAAGLSAVRLGAGQGGVTAVPVVLAALVLGAAAVLHVLRPRGSWILLGAAVGASALLVGLQLLLLTDAVSDLLRAVGTGVPRGTGVRPSRGAHLLLAGGALAAAWSVLAVATCPPRRGPAAG